MSSATTGEPLFHETHDLSTWSTDHLITRVAFLEKQLKEQTLKYNSTALSPKPTSPARKPKKAGATRVFDPSKYSTRFIALKFAYLGQRYNGLEYHPNNTTPLPTVEEELWKALNKTRLVFPTPNPLLAPDEPNWEGCEYSKCGRTDRGVSAFGQVVGIRVRSNRPVNGAKNPTSADDAVAESADHSNSKDPETFVPSVDPVTSLDEDATTTAPSGSEISSDKAPSFHPIQDEIQYCQVLNRILPPDIRMLAWCPNPPVDFSARFSCRERRYRYFFTQPAFEPTPGAAGLLGTSNTPGSSTGRRREGWLDIDAMREAAHKFIGLHDFRNFCKIDPSKQIENFERRIFHADIEKIDSRHGPASYIGRPSFQQYEHPNQTLSTHLDDELSKAQSSTPTIYTFTLHGAAFLWHQVRHMVAILFLIGQGLEPPSLIDDLLDISKTPSRPHYQMADDAPLVLWDCIFPREGHESREDVMEWVYVGDDGVGRNKNGSGIARKGDGKFGRGGVVDHLWGVWRGRKMDEVLAGSLLDVVVGQGSRAAGTDDPHSGPETEGKSPASQMIFQGGDGPKAVGKYVPVMQTSRMDSVDVINARYAKRKGFEEKEEFKEQGFRRLNREGVEESGA